MLARLGAAACAATAWPARAGIPFKPGQAEGPTAQGWGYCVFGRVVEGQDVVDRIKKVRTGSRAGHQDVPQEDVIIERAEVV